MLALLDTQEAMLKSLRMWISRKPSFISSAVPFWSPPVLSWVLYNPSGISTLLLSCAEAVGSQGCSGLAVLWVSSRKSAFLLHLPNAVWTRACQLQGWGLDRVLLISMLASKSAVGADWEVGNYLPMSHMPWLWFFQACFLGENCVLRFFIPCCYAIFSKA